MRQQLMFFSVDLALLHYNIYSASQDKQKNRRFYKKDLTFWSAIVVATSTTSATLLVRSRWEEGCSLRYSLRINCWMIQNFAHCSVHFSFKKIKKKKCHLWKLTYWLFCLAASWLMHQSCFGQFSSLQEPKRDTTGKDLLKQQSSLTHNIELCD